MQEGPRRLAGRYQLAEIIGRGGMGTVHRATDLVLDRTVAVKLLPAAIAEEDSRHVARFEREARAAASLTHPGVVAVYDTGEDEATRFIVMECVAGRSLSEVLRDEAPLEPARAASIASRIAAALAAAHAAGIVHRDVKPGNVMLARDGAVKVLDFGIARSLNGSSTTQGVAVLGTAGYMAPEQALGDHADERSDIYSLGCLLYALLTGRPPFDGDAPAAVLHQHVNSDARAPSTLNGEVPAALDAIVMRMLAKSPDVRTQSAERVRAELNAVLGASPEEPPLASTAPTARVDRTASTRVLSAPAKARRRHRAPAAAAVALAALLTIAVIALALGAGPRKPRARTGHVATSSKRGLASASAATTASPPSHPSAAPQPAQSATAPTAAQGAPPAAITVAGAAGALTSLVAQDVQSGTIEQQAAQQITNGLADILTSYETGHTTDAEHKLADLTQKAAMLQEQGQIAPAAAAPLDASLAGLTAAIQSSSPPTPPPKGGQPEVEGAPLGAVGGQGPRPGGPRGRGHGHRPRGD